MHHSWVPRVDATFLLTCLLLTILRQVGGLGQVLYFSTVGDRERDTGLWGGYIDDRLDGDAPDLRQYGFFCADMKGGDFYSGLSIESTSYDQLSGKILLKIDEKARTTTSALTFNSCDIEPSCSTPDSSILFYLAENTDDLQKAKIGPMAMWNSSIYFVSQRFTKGSKARSRIHKMEIRKLIPCSKHFPFTSSNKFNVDTCSEFIAPITEEVGYDIVLLMRETLSPAGHLQIVPEGDQLHFLLQINNYTFDEERELLDYSMDLVSVTPSSVRLLHRQRIPLRYTWDHFAQLGGVSYKAGILCWTAMDSVLCARWQPSNGLRNVHTVLHPGLAGRVCTVSDRDDKIYRNVTTGIAISSVDDGIRFYFGCYASSSETGGAGFVHLSKDWKTFDIFPLTERKGQVFAGSMFVAPPCDNMVSDQQPSGADFNSNEVVVVAEKSTSGTISSTRNTLYMKIVGLLLFLLFR